MNRFLAFDKWVSGLQNKTGGGVSCRSLALEGKRQRKPIPIVLGPSLLCASVLGQRENFSIMEIELTPTVVLSPLSSIIVVFLFFVVVFSTQPSSEALGAFQRTLSAIAVH